MTEKKISEMNLLRVDPTRQLIVKGFQERFWNLIKNRLFSFHLFFNNYFKEK